MGKPFQRKDRDDQDWHKESSISCLSARQLKNLLIYYRRSFK